MPHMPHIHWVTRQNKLEIPKDKDEVNKQDIHEYDGRAHDPDTLVAPLTPKPKRKAEALTRVPPTIASSHEEDAVLRKWPMLMRLGVPSSESRKRELQKRLKKYLQVYYESMKRKIKI
jgi:hypothetical protein